MSACYVSSARGQEMIGAEAKYLPIEDGIVSTLRRQRSRWAPSPCVMLDHGRPNRLQMLAVRWGGRRMRSMRQGKMPCCFARSNVHLEEESGGARTDSFSIKTRNCVHSARCASNIHRRTSAARTRSFCAPPTGNGFMTRGSVSGSSG